ncbi:hypothetical protein PFLUV_G00048510 [Perca fluviatilis]|uniref:Uncharacterized protein n=1 Tax=Perca fluviatilis TaxID=8168 RepID=A0A6A5ES13_PERFL|nr:hypothetical protein PFLUV_G00048510 [Perca fluviatilis]
MLDIATLPLPLAALAGDHRDACAGPGSVVTTESLWEATRIKVSPGCAWSFLEDILLKTRRDYVYCDVSTATTKRG